MGSTVQKLGLLKAYMILNRERVEMVSESDSRGVIVRVWLISGTVGRIQGVESSCMTERWGGCKQQKLKLLSHSPADSISRSLDTAACCFWEPALSYQVLSEF